MKPKLYIIAGCNGAGKTTASFTILPEILNVQEFVNADEIARGISPFQPEKAGIEAGRIMLERIDDLIARKVDFAFETTLATRSYAGKIKKAKVQGYYVILIFFWLESIELAKERVNVRVSEGGHNIPEDIIERRYNRGLRNFFQLYQNEVDEWMFMDNSYGNFDLISKSDQHKNQIVINDEIWSTLERNCYEK
ncbi:MAG: zeta toxin [Cytophagales bacterium CG12_big_fil_rev_8_21_14_0_65_40_12]|nr:MAG: zeta toxin [Cytophagales bacterium CG12_big_fil_rev_8_21_14_0_65_40_12]PIW04367.1 MAG: zeta toxin [Cytophagales bacterium CG17_big_fil_post_rev_8_21_14_2_50_40_13]